MVGAFGSQDYSIAYFQPLETGGKRSKRLEVARLGLELARAEADERKRQLTLEVRQRYAEALSARRRLAVLVEAGRVHAETLHLVAARVEEGDAAPLEKRLLETDVTRAEVDRMTAEAKVETAFFQLRRIGALDEAGETPGVLVGENAADVTARIRDRIESFQKYLPPGVRIEPLYDRTDLVRRTIGTVTRNLVEGGLLVSPFCSSCSAV